MKRTIVIGVIFLRCVAAALAAWSGAAWAQRAALAADAGIPAPLYVPPPPPPPPPPPSKYREDFEDLSEKVMGGRLAVKRTYDGYRWLPNQGWADLVLVKPLSPSYGAISVGYSSGGGGGSGGSVGSVGAIVMPPVNTGGGTAPPPDIPSHAIGTSDVVRATAVYKGQGGGVFTYGLRNLIRATDTGWRWQDRDGHTADYDTAGRLLFYKDRNGVRVSFQRDAEHRITGVFDTLGRQVLWLEYANNRLSAVRDSTNRRVEYQYTNNRMTKVIDVRGNAWLYEYTSNGTPSSRTDPEGRKLKLAGGSGWVWEGKDQDGAGANYKSSYDKSKKQFYVQAKTAGGLVTEAWYDAEGHGIRQEVNGKTIRTLVIDGRTRTAIDRNGGRTVNVYDEYDNLLSRTHPDGSAVQYVYEPQFSMVTRETDENGVVTAFEYDERGNLNRRTEAVNRPEQRVIVYTYDAYGNRITARRLADQRTPESLYQYAYDDSGNLTQVTSPEGSVTHYAYDVMGDLISITDPREKVWSRTYDDGGWLLTEASPLGVYSTFEYNRVGDKTRRIDARGKAWTFEYDRQHRLTRITNPLGDRFLLTYNVDGQITREVDEEGKAATYQYDLGGRLLKVVDGNGNMSSWSFADDGVPGSGGFLDAVKIKYPTFERQYAYDRRNRVTVETDLLGSDGASTGYAYDAKGRVVRATDTNGRARVYEYDAFDNMTKKVDPDGHAAQYEYDNRNNLIAVIDANGHTSRFEYDRQNRLTKVVRPLGQTVRYTYDTSDNVADRVDALGRKTRYVYDDANRLIGREYFASAGDTTPAQTESYTLDANGSLTVWSDGTFSGTLERDDLWRHTAETVNYGGFALSDQYGYYRNGTISNFTAPDGISYAYTYDAASQLTSVATPAGSLTITDYFWTVPSAGVLPGGTTQSLTYNGLLNLQNLQVKGPTQSTVLEFNNTYDRLQNVSHRTIGDVSVDYTYDAKAQLTKIQSDGGTQSFTYDPVGNRVADAAGAWTYNANDQLVSRPGVTYGYDDNGNLTLETQGAQSRRFFYDFESRLARVEDGAGAVIARYGYDPFHRRLYKDVGEVRTYFFYADQGLIAEANASGAVVKSYGYHPQSASSTHPLFVKTSAGYAFYHLDQLGTPIALTDRAGRVVWSVDYDAFGKVTLRASEVTSNLRFPGQYWDAETGLHYNEHRYYDPSIGRYLQPEPLLQNPGALKVFQQAAQAVGDSLGGYAWPNAYAYALNNPINRVDEDGLSPKSKPRDGYPRGPGDFCTLNPEGCPPLPPEPPPKRKPGGCPPGPVPPPDNYPQSDRATCVVNCVKDMNANFKLCNKLPPEVQAACKKSAGLVAIGCTAICMAKYPQ